MRSSETTPREGHANRRRLIFALVAALLLLSLCFKAIVRGDGIGYYGYLPAVVGQRSLDLRPTFDDFLAAGVPVWNANLEKRLPNGLTADFKQVGSAVMAAPFYAGTSLLLALTPGSKDMALNPAYQLAFTAAGLFYIVLALLVLYGFIARHWGAWAARLALAAAVFGTPLVAYLLFEPSYSHAFSVAAIILFALLLYQTGPNRRWWQWLVIGLIGGVMAITHIQEALFLALLPAEGLWLMASRRWSPRQLQGYLLAAVGIAIGVLPQVAVDKLLFGRWLPPSAPDINFNFLHPHLLELLTSPHHGWISWSPIVLVALFGLPLVIRRFGWFAVALIAIGLGEIWINSAISDWWGGLGFGARRLTDQTLLLALCFGAVFNWMRSRVPALAVGLVSLGIAWTVILLAQFYYVIRVDKELTWREFLVGQVQALRYVPRLFIQGTVIRDLALGPMLFGCVAAVALGLTLGAAWWLSQRLSAIRSESPAVMRTEY